MEEKKITVRKQKIKKDYTKIKLAVYGALTLLLILVAGVVVLFNPFEAAEVPFIFLGASAVVYSLTDLLRLIRFRRRRGQVEIIVSEEKKED